MSAAELGPGRYHFAGQEVEVSEELRVAAPGAPNLAGSALTLDRAVLLVTQRCGVPFSEAWAMASTRPASFLGLRQPDSVRVMVSQGGMTRLR
jgi:N-acetylglucosamine-6-phosphate deacetylase